jgi:hypothetical protein
MGRSHGRSRDEWIDEFVIRYDLEEAAEMLTWLRRRRAA